MLFQDFCNGSFWNESLLLNNSWPQFTECFQETAVIWVPCGFLWITSCIYCSWLIYSNIPKPRSVTRLIFFKTLISFLLTALSITILITTWGKVDTTYAYKTAFVVKSISYFLTVLLMQLDRRYGVTSSGVLFLYWGLETLTSIVPFYSGMMLQTYDDRPVVFELYNTVFVLVVIQFFLHWFADTPKTSEYSLLTEQRACPEIIASFPSKLLIWWMTKLIIKGYRRGIKEAEMWQLNPRDASSTLVPRFELEWNRQLSNTTSVRHSVEESFAYGEKTPLISTKIQNGDGRHAKAYNSVKQPSLIKLLWRLFRVRFLVVTMMKITADTLKQINTLVMGALITYISEKREGTEWQGYTLAASLFCVQVVANIFQQNSIGYANILGMQMKTVCVSAVYKKALTISNEARKTTTSGEILNLMSVDSQRIQDVMGNFYNIITVPIQITISTVLIYNTIGPSSFAGIALLFLLIPLNSVLGNWQKKLQVKNLRLKDQRLKLLDEILNGIKVLKLYAWEEPFIDRVRSVRREEVKLLLRITYSYIFTGVTTAVAPFMIVLVTYTAYILSDPSHILDANTAFVTLSLNNQLRMPMFRFPTILASTIQAYVSVKRINRFLCKDDLNDDNIQVDKTAESSVTVKNGKFTWDTSMSPTLRNINVDIKEGSLVAVVGVVGSGKSSLLSAILGEMVKLKGNVTINSGTAYVPQTAWIQNKTLRDNVLFGKKLRQQKYNTVIDACALDADLALLPSGDTTEIGEKGINLSGGQKQRVSLARAVYRNSSIYLLDDPLSAVDSHVGKHIFNRVIGPKGLLRGKTRVLVTHAVHLLPVVDEIIVMNNGSVSECGSYEQLMTHDGPFAQFLKTYLTEREQEEDPETERLLEGMWDRMVSLTSDDTSGCESMVLRRRSSQSRESQRDAKGGHHPDKPDPSNRGRGRLVETEKVATGKVKWSVFYTYGKAAGFPTFLLALMLFFTQQGLNSGAGFYLTYWTEDPVLMNSSLPVDQSYNLNKQYLGIYSTFALGFAVVIAGANYFLRTRMVRAASRLHNAILDRVFRSPMSFFDTTPSGRIINRLSRDIETIDNTMPMNVRMFMQQFSSVFAILVTICINTPLFISVMVPLILLYILIQHFYIPTSRQLKRIESVTRSPIYVHFSETISGASSIRAFGVTDIFVEESQRKVDKNQTFYFAGVMATRWLGFYLDLIGSTVIFSAAIFAVLTPGTTGSIVGLSVTYALQISNSLSMIVRQVSSLETNAVAVERVKEYSELPTEGEWIKPDSRPPASWPDNGRIEVTGYSTRYRPGLDFVLRDINFSIDEGQKIGVVGRTGSGKSSLTLALFRLLEAGEGSIYIDNINIASLGLHDIRSRITILPQDPILFSGSLRINLDPFSQYDDDAVWAALDRAHLRQFVKGVPGQLLYDCGERGDNLSVGQRQLVCLARALLRHSKILVLDEATAAVDMETDSLIQATIREAFQDCTIITIAHRISTVMDYDRILVLDNGKVLEYGSPTDLLLEASSAFHGLAKSSGIVYS